MKSWLCSIICILISSTTLAYTCETSWCRNILHTWEDGKTEAYLPVWTWHNRAKYDDEHLSHYNEFPLGAGIGKYYYDSDGDLHRLGGMVFLDSHSNVEPLAGYSFEKIFRPGGGDLKLGLGYTAFLTAREDIGHYIPFPGVLPIWSLQYGRFSLEQTYIPGGSNNGNVLFTWLRIEF